MSKVDQSTLSAFGTAVLRANSLRGWTLDELASAMDGACGKSMLSKITKGKRDSISPRIVGKLIAALKLDESWIDRFIAPDGDEGAEETQAERDADRVMARLGREGATEDAPEELLIQLANTYSEGQHRDWETAYVSVKIALETFADMKRRRELRGNTETQFQSVMEEVERLNELGDVESAGDALDEAMKRHEQERDAIFQQQLNQDRLRGRSDLAAKRLIKDLRREAHPGGLFQAIDGLAVEWSENGDKAGDIFALRVAVEIAKDNYERNKTKKALAASALHTLGWCYLRVALRSTHERHLKVAKNASEAALQKTSRAKDPLNWSARQGGLGSVLKEMGARAADADLLKQAVSAHRVALDVTIAHSDEFVEVRWHNLGTALQKLGEVTRTAAPVQEAVEAQIKALAFIGKAANPLG